MNTEGVPLLDATTWHLGTLVPLKGKGLRTQVLLLAAPPFRPKGETYRRFALKDIEIRDIHPLSPNV